MQTCPHNPVACALLVFLMTAAHCADYSLWPAPSVQKIFRDDQPPEAIPEAQVCLAANEAEAIQIVITAGNDALDDVQVTVRWDDGRFPPPANGAPTLPPIDVGLLLPHYVPCPSAGRDFPDPLPPLDGPFRVEAGQSQPVWLELEAPEGASPGEWRLVCSVKPSNGPANSLTVRVIVDPFALPDEGLPLTTFGVSDAYVLAQHGVEADTAHAKALITNYYEFLLDHRVSAYSLPVRLKSPDARKYLDDPRLTSFVIPWTEDEAELRDIAQYLDENGWLDKGYLYVVDEPIGKEQYDRIREVAEKAQRAHPKLRLVAPFYRAPDWDDALTAFDVLTGSLDIWCPNEHYFDLNPLIYEQFRERQAAGEDGWFYVCCGPGAPYNNFFVQMDGFAHRLIFTQMWRLGVTGLLYWNTTWWRPESGGGNPWEDMATVKDINPNIYGDGSLLYPGTQVGIDGPVASVRLKLIRDGIEDYQYLYLLAQRRGREAADRASRALCRSLTDYTRDAAKLTRIRRKIAAEIIGE